MRFLRTTTGRMGGRASRRALRLERLENRDTPAGTIGVTFAGGVLTLTSHDSAIVAELDQDIILRDNGGAGTVMLVGRRGETFSGTGGLTQFSGVGAIVINMGAGNDSCEIDQINLVTVTGKLTFNGGQGNNLLTLNASNGSNSFTGVSVTNGDGEDGLLVEGVFVGRTNTLGALIINNGAGKSTTYLGTGANSVTMAKSISYIGGSGEDGIATFGTLNVTTGGVSLALGNGPGGVVWQASSTIAGNLNVTGGADDDIVQFNSSGKLSASGATTINLGNGNGGVSLTPVGGLNLGMLTIVGGTGSDGVALGQPGSAVSLSGLTFKAGAGDNSLFLSGATNAIAGAVSVTAGGGSDTFRAQGGSFTSRSLVLNLGNGANTVSLASTLSTTINGPVSFTGGAGTDTFNALTGNLTTTAGILLNLGDSASNVSFTGPATTIGGALTVTARDGLVTLTIGGNAVQVGAVSLNFGDGGSTTSISGVTSTTLGGTLTLNAGAGPDEFNLGGGIVSTKGVRINVGTGSSSVNIDAVSSGTIAGSLGIVAGDGRDLVRLTRLAVAQATTISPGVGGSRVTIGDIGAPVTLGSLNLLAGDGIDIVLLRSATVIGATTMATGDGNDYLQVDDSHFLGPVLMNLGAGNDAVLIEMSGSNGAATTFSKAARIDLSSGDDLLQLSDNGTSSLDTIEFNGGVLVTAGFGIDTINVSNAFSAGLVVGATTAILTTFEFAF